MLNKMQVAGVMIAGFFLYVPPSVYAEKFYMEAEPNIAKAEKSILSGNLEEASKYYNRAIRSGIDTDRLVSVLNNLCIVEYALGKAEQAIEACTGAIEKKTRFWQAYVNRANARLALGDVEGAKADYKQASKYGAHNQAAQGLALLNKDKTLALAK